jgi:peptidoglycan biosynthesis protein MviN/MurJ (putative lipid II flippase)
MIFERKAFTSADTAAVYYAFAIYLLALPASVIGTVVSHGFYVLQRNKTIAFIGIMMMGLYIGLCATFVHFMAYFAIPVAYVIYQNCAIFTTSMVIKNKTGMHWRSILSFFLKSTMVAITVLVILYPPVVLGRDNMFILTILCMLGFLIYFLISKSVLMMDEANLIWQAISFRFKERDIL